MEGFRQRINVRLLGKLFSTAERQLLAGIGLVLLGLTVWRYTELGNLAEWITAATTLILAIVAWIQLQQQTLAQRQWATLQACDRYDTDEVLNRSIAVIRAFRHGKWDGHRWHASSPRDLINALKNIFNFFDAIALGLRQRLYVREIVTAHLQNIVFGYWDFLQSVKGQHSLLGEFDNEFETNYASIYALIKEWKRDKERLCRK